MKVTVITAVVNSARTISDCMDSVLGQSHRDLEYIVVDGGSTDGTAEIIAGRRDRLARFLSGPDRGMYDAMNKGIALATGDIVGILNADDVYAHEGVVATVASRMEASGADSCYGDLVYVSARRAGKIVRHWRSRHYAEGLFEKGWMPPHPTFFARRKVYEAYGGFDLRFTIAADYELMLRLLARERISTLYIPEVLVRMRTGGASNRSIRNMVVKTAEDYRAWSVNGLRRRFFTVPLKVLTKIPQFF